MSLPAPTPPAPSPADQSIARLEGLAHRVVTGAEGQRIAWRLFGHGPALVLLHGGHGSWLHWARNIEALAQRHRVLVPDLPGFGDSDDLPGPPHAPDRLDRLVRALGQGVVGCLGPRPQVDLAGFSFGGLIAATAAAAWAPDLSVRRLLLLGPGGHGQRRPRHVDFVDWRLPEPAQRRAALRRNLEAFMFHDPARADDLALAIHTLACERTRFRSRALSVDDGLWPALAAFGGPVHALWGEDDATAVPHELGPLLRARHPGATWQTIPGAGHWAAYEAADAVNAAMLGAMAR